MNMITIIVERIRKTLLLLLFSLKSVFNTFAVNFTFTYCCLIFLNIMNNQLISLVSCSKNLSFIQGSPIKCSNEGQIVKVPFLSKDPCITCKCMDGEIACQRVSCFGYKGGGLASLTVGSGGGGGEPRGGGGRGTSYGTSRRIISSNYNSNNNNNNAIHNGVGICKIENNNVNNNSPQSSAVLNTFDGYTYKYIGQYNYVLARDCSKKIFSIHLVNTESNAGGQLSSLSSSAVPSPSALPLSSSPSHWSTNSIGDNHRLPLMMNTINHHQLNYSLITNSLTNTPHHQLSRPSYNTLVVKINGIKVRISQSDVRIGRKPIVLPYVKLGVLSVIRDGRKIIVRSNIGIRVIWDRANSTQVYIPRTYRNKVCGLCGNFNDNPKDDLRTKRGLRIGDMSAFFNSWKVGGSRGLKDVKDVIVLKLYQYTRLRTRKRKSHKIS